MSYDGMSAGELAGRLGVENCYCLAKVTSTLDVIHQLAEEESPEGTVVLADEQVRGRGRFGRTWSSPPKIGIWLGYLFRPKGAVAGGIVAIRAGLMLIETLEELGIEAELKWPNDVLLGGRKLCGVLCEARSAVSRAGWIGIGIGMNVHAGLPAEYEAGSAFVGEVLPEISRVDVLEVLLPRLRKISDAPLLRRSERMKYESRNWLVGKRLRSPAAGFVRGVDGDGALLLETEYGIERIVGGTVVAA